MARPVRDHVTMEIAAQKREITQKVQYLVSNTLVRVSQGVLDHTLGAEDQQVGRGGSSPNACLAERSGLGFEQKCPAGSQLGGKCGRVDLHEQALRPDWALPAIVEVIGEHQSLARGGSWIGRQGCLAFANRDRLFKNRDLARAGQ